MKEEKKKFIALTDLEIYKLSSELSEVGWEIYKELGWQDKKIMGDQFISATDSVGANIAEGYARFHYLDRIKFLYNSRGSLNEANGHWLELLWKRQKVEKILYSKYMDVAQKLSLKLQNFISSIYKAKQDTK